MLRLVTHEYFMDEMQWADLNLMLKYTEFADVQQWDMTRRIMMAACGPYLSKSNRNLEKFLPLPIDDDGTVHTTEMTKEDERKAREFIEYVKKKKGEQ